MLSQLMFLNIMGYVELNQCFELKAMIKPKHSLRYELNFSGLPKEIPNLRF
jgi:hypothetical protein